MNKSTFQKFNTLATGITLGIIVPVVVYFLLYFAKVQNIHNTLFSNRLLIGNIVPILISHCVLPNLVLFFIFNGIAGQTDDPLDVVVRRRRVEDNDVKAFRLGKIVIDLIDDQAVAVFQGRHHRLAFDHIIRKDEATDDDRDDHCDGEGFQPFEDLFFATIH